MSTTDDQAEPRPETAPADTTPKPQRIRKTLGLAHRFIEICGEHPFATGLFALLSVVGMIFSMFTFSLDQQAAQEATEQAARVESKIDQISGRLGSDHNGGVFLFEEKVEMYWNDWWAHPLMIKEEIAEVKQAEMTIRGEGKTAEFTGVLSINCTNGQYFWRSVQNFLNADPNNAVADKVVPEQVIRNAKKLFCW